MPVPHSLPWLRFQSPLVGRVESWRAAGRVRWLIRRFRTGPQSGSRGHVSSSRLVKPSIETPATLAAAQQLLAQDQTIRLPRRDRFAFNGRCEGLS